MTMQLVPMDNDQDFLMQLNLATGHAAALPHLKMVKFDAQTGQFKLETDEKTEDNKPVYSDIGETIELHIIKIRTMIQSKFNVQNRFYSREFDGGLFQLMDDNKTVLWAGEYGQFKGSAFYNDAQYVKVIYAFHQNKLVRMKLAGSKLSPLFDYIDLFKQDNPARYMTKMSKGQSATSGGIKYFEMTIEKTIALPIDIVIDHVNAVNEFLSLYQQSAGANVIQGSAMVDAPLPVEEMSYHADDAVAQKFNDLPF